jgi:pyruvate dehydrogenase E2 component (dihydrolipoamide acetyltransferase)
MTDITMPRLSDSMEEGTVLTWLKKNGGHVDRGDELVEIETDKATMTYESPEAGTLEILAVAGTSLPVGAPIARVGAASPASPAAARSADPVVVPEAVPDAPMIVATATATAPPAAAPPGANGGGTGTKVRATPLARRVAAELGLDLTQLSGTGPNGRITRGDVAAAVSLDARGVRAPMAAPTPDAVPAAATPVGAGSAPGSKGVTTLRELTRVQALIARRMAETKATVPDFQVQTEVAMNALLALRGQLKAIAERPPSVNDFIVKAAALALREFPLANGSYRDGRFELHERVNVGIAVAADDALVVPTVPDADTRSVSAIAAETRRLAAAVRDGTVTPPELTGATFTVSNLGMYGMTAIVPVINAPQAAILGVGSLRPVLALEDGEVRERQLMTLTLSCDHRILYGAEASSFLSRIRALLEQPLLLAV